MDPTDPMTPPERDKRTTDHPVAYTVKPGERNDGGADVGLRMGLIAVVSGGIALLIRKTLYPELLRIQPENLPVTVPPALGFYAVGHGIATTVFIAGSKDTIPRRRLFYSVAAGLGAGIGAMFGAASELAGANDPPDETIPVAGKDEEDPSVEKCEDEPGSDDTDSNHSTPPP